MRGQEIHGAGRPGFTPSCLLLIQNPMVLDALDPRNFEQNLLKTVPGAMFEPFLLKTGAPNPCKCDYFLGKTHIYETWHVGGGLRGAKIVLAPRENRMLRKSTSKRLCLVLELFKKSAGFTERIGPPLQWLREASKPSFRGCL